MCCGFVFKAPMDRLNNKYKNNLLMEVILHTNKYHWLNGQLNCKAILNSFAAICYIKLLDKMSFEFERILQQTCKIKVINTKGTTQFFTLKCGKYSC